MRVWCVSFTARGAGLCRKVIRVMTEDGYECQGFAMPRDAADGLFPLKEGINAWTEKAFQNAQIIVFIGACGIAVRAIAPYLKDKFLDPAVVSIDEFGQFVIPLLSGHVGGANSCAVYLAGRLKATPVVSTATDLNGCFAVDRFASEYHLYLSDRDIAKEVSVALLRRETVFLKNEFPDRYSISLFPGLVCSDFGKLGILISLSDVKKPFERTLTLIPKQISVGIGCKKETAFEMIESAVQCALAAADISIHAVKCVRSVSLKAEEPGILKFCERYGVPFLTDSPEVLNQLEGEFSPSEFVQKVVGIDNVCERSAVSGGGKLLLKKQKYPSVTVAIALEEERTPI